MRELVSPPRNRGRPKGSKNKATILNEIVKAQFDTVLVERFPELLQKTLELADMGNPTCLKILWDRLLPAKKMTKEANEGFTSGVNITINAVPGPDGGSGITILGEKQDERKSKESVKQRSTGKHLQRAVPAQEASPEAESPDADATEIWQERKN